MPEIAVRTLPTVQYTPPELGKKVTVTYFEHTPDSIDSKFLRDKKKVLLVADDNLDEAKIEYVRKLLQEFVPDVLVFRLPYQEKNLSQVEKIWQKMVAEHPDIAVALGGGTTCDLVGFAASSYHRGFEHIFFPTTLLGMVDACIGGKTGIDFGGIKNSIGQVHYAVESFCFLPFLKTLPYEELKSGISEIIKAAILFDPGLFTLLEKTSAKFRVSEDWLEIISRSASIKAKMSEQSFSQRSKLLYGHNIGHGLEMYDHQHRRHGDCVSIGMNYELALAVTADKVDREIWEKQTQLLEKFDLVRFFWDDLDIKKLATRMKLYKLYKDKQFLFVVPQTIGNIMESNKNFYWQIDEDEFQQLLTKAAKKLHLPL